MRDFLFGISLIALLAHAVAAQTDTAIAPPNADDTSFANEATWQPVAPAEAKRQVDQWMAAVKPGEGTDPAVLQNQIDDLWRPGLSDPARDKDAAPRVDGGTLVDLVAASFTVADAPSREIAKLCSKPRVDFQLPDFAWLKADATPPFQAANLQLLYGRWLVQQALFDEAAAVLLPLKAESVVDPAGLLFYQAVLHQRLLQASEGLAAVDRLLEQADKLPLRYASLARLLKADLEQLKDDSLDHVARRMDDVRRRLDLGRPGPKTQEVEEGVIKSLDKMIEEIEKQQQQQQGQANGKGGIRSNGPAPDSRPLEGKGPGQVDRKPIGTQSGWGELPPKERQEAMQQIGKEFPPHYRDMIEQYFRKLASEGETAEAGR